MAGNRLCKCMFAENKSNISHSTIVYESDLISMTISSSIVSLFVDRRLQYSHKGPMENMIIVFGIHN